MGCSMKVISVIPKGKFDIIKFDNDTEVKICRNTRFKIGIVEGREVDEIKVEEMKYLSSLECAYDDALKYLKYKHRSVTEVKMMLKKKHYKQEVIENTIKRLKKLSLLDDDEFVKMWISDRKTRKPRGRKLIHYELEKKGIPVEKIKENLSTLTFEDEADMARRLIKKRFKVNESINKEKIMNYLYIKGFSLDVIQMVLKEIEERDT